MLKRRWSLIVAVAVIVLAVFLKNVLSRQKHDPPRTPDNNRSRTVTTLVAKGSDVQLPVMVSGRLTAMERAELFAEVQGILLKNPKPFREGVAFSNGETMLRIDDKELRMNLASLKGTLLNAVVAMLPDMKIDLPDAFARWQQFLTATDIDKPLPALPSFATEKEKYFVVSRNILSQYYNISAQQVRLDKYSIRAPYSGIVSQALISEGTLVRAGQKLGEFVSAGLYEFEAGIANDDLSLIATGAKVQLKSDSHETTWIGTVVRINPAIDAATQTVKVYVHVNGQGLREGMFLSGSIQGKTINNALELPRNLLLANDAIYIVKASTLKLAHIDVIRFSGNNMIVSGLQDGDRVVTETVPGGFDGMSVTTAE